LRGPYLVDGETIDKVVSSTSPGVYALGYVDKDVFYVQHVGRSNNINRRLRQWVGKHYALFKFRYFDSPKAAFEKECILWHDFFGPEGDNKPHPEREENDWKCPICER